MQHAPLEGHTRDVNAVCAVTVNGRPMLASGGDDNMVRIWNPATRQQHDSFQGHQGSVSAVCAVTVDGGAHARQRQL